MCRLSLAEIPSHLFRNVKRRYFLQLDNMLALNDAISIEITTAIRDTTIDDVVVRQGQIIGLLNGKLVAAGDEMLGVLLSTLHRAHAEDRELVTFYYGSETDEVRARALVDELSSEFGDLTFEVINGGQPLYPYIISIE